MSPATDPTTELSGTVCDHDALVILHLRGGGVDDRSNRDRLGLLALDLGAGQNQQVGAVAAHSRGKVVELEQGVEPLRVVLVAFEVVDQRQLLVDQRPAAPRHRLEHVADVQLQPRLLGRHQQRLLVQVVDGVGDLPDLVGGVHGDRLDRSRLLARADAFDLGGQFLVRDPQRAFAEPPKGPHQRSGDQQHQQQCDQERGQHDRGVPDGRGARRRRLLVHRGGDRRRGVVNDPLGDVLGGLQRGQQVRVTDQHRGRVGDDGHPGDHLVLQCLRLRRADVQHLVHPEQRGRLGTGERDHRRAQFGLGHVAATVDQQLLHEHLAACAHRAAEALGFRPDLFVVDPNRSDDRVLGGQQDRRVRRHRVAQLDAVRRDPVQQRRAAVQQRGDTGPDVGIDVGAGQFALKLGAGVIERLARHRAVGPDRIGEQSAFQCPVVVFDRPDHVGEVNDMAQIPGGHHAVVDAQTAEHRGEHHRNDDDRKYFPARRPVRRGPPRRALGRRRGGFFFCLLRQHRLLEHSHRIGPIC